MPGFDKTGPFGQGSRTGRGFGPCGLGLGWRKRFGFGRGLGRYFRGGDAERRFREAGSYFNWGWPETEEDQAKALKEYEKALREELEDVEKELKEVK